MTNLQNSIRIEHAPAVFALGNFCPSEDFDQGGRYELHVAATTHSIASLHHSGTIFGFHQLIVKWQNLGIDAGAEGHALCGELFFALEKLRFFCG